MRQKVEISPPKRASSPKIQPNDNSKSKDILSFVISWPLPQAISLWGKSSSGARWFHPSFWNRVFWANIPAAALFQIKPKDLALNCCCFPFNFAFQHH